MKTEAFIILVVLIFVGAVVVAPPKAPIGNLLPPAESELRLTVVDTAEGRAKGLAALPDRLALDAGMLFVFDSTAVQCMWNKGISYPVAVAFFDENRRLMETKIMRPHSTDPTCSTKPARYALEVNAVLAN